MKAQGTSFTNLLNVEDNKEELQGFYQDPISGQHEKKIKSYESPPTSNTNNLVMLVVAIVCIGLVIFAINYHFSEQAVKPIKGQSERGPIQGVGSNQDLKKKISDIESNEEKIMAKLSQINKKIESLDQQSVNVLDPNSPNQEKANTNTEELKTEMQKISKELIALKHSITSINQNIKKDEINARAELSSLKELIQKDIEDYRNSNIEVKRGQPRLPRPTIQKEAQDRQFEADFVTQDFQEVKQQKFNANSEVYVDNNYIFDIPKKLWLYTQTKNTYMNHLVYENNQYFANKSKYEVFIVNRTNYKSFLSLKNGQNVQKFITFLEKRAQGDDSTNFRHHVPNIIKKYILLSILNENGGVISNGEFAMTEDLSWINTIIKNQYVNRGNRGVKPQIVGFYSHDLWFQKSRQNIKPFEGLNPVDAYVTVFPALQDYFIAAEKNTIFMTKVISTINRLLKNPKDFLRERGRYKLNNLKGEDMFYEFFLIAVQVVLQDKQKQIDIAGIDKFRHFSIDYYGLYLINCYYGPYKFKAFWGDGQSIKAFQSMTQYPMEEFQANLGPMRYIAKVTPVAEMNGYLQDIKYGKKKPVLEGSFIQKIFYPTKGLPYVKKNVQKHFVNITNEQWTSLPKIIWVFWDKGLSAASVNNQICVENLKRMGKLSGFVVNEVNLSNINEYLDQQTLDMIQNSLDRAQLTIYPQSKADLIRLALLIKYGGIYMDASYVAVQNFDWLINIGRYPSQYVFNRYGSLPKVFMMWHPHYGSPLEWTINQKYNIKTQWHLAYENNFIAAEKDNELIKEWFQLLLSLYVKPFQEVQRIFQDCNIYSHKWSTNNWHYLIPMDTIKCVVGRKEMQIVQQNPQIYVDASDYYKLWSFSGYLGQQKLRLNTNFESPGSENNLFVYRYSQDYVEGLIGKIRHLVKFYSQHNKELTMFVARHIDGDFSSEAHPDSIFMRYMWDKKFELMEVNFYPKLKTLS